MRIIDYIYISVAAGFGGAVGVGLTERALTVWPLRRPGSSRWTMLYSTDSGVNKKLVCKMISITFSLCLVLTGAPIYVFV